MPKENYCKCPLNLNFMVFNKKITWIFDTFTQYSREYAASIKKPFKVKYDPLNLSIELLDNNHFGPFCHKKVLKPTNISE